MLGLAKNIHYVNRLRHILEGSIAGLAVDLLEGGLKSLSRTEPVTPSAIPT